MKVHFSSWISIPVLFAGLVILGLGIWLALLTSSVNPQIAIGAIISLIGVLYMINPVFALEADSIAVYRPIGSVKQRYHFQSRSEIRVNGNQLFVGNDRVPIQKWGLNQSQWQAFKESIAR